MIPNDMYTIKSPATIVKVLHIRTAPTIGSTHLIGVADVRAVEDGRYYNIALYSDNTIAYGNLGLEYLKSICPEFLS